MKILVTGSAGHLGEALVRTLKTTDDEPIGVDMKASKYTECVGSITNRDFVRECVAPADAIVHTATLHKPHVGTHTRQDFVDTNITGTLNLLEQAIANNCKSFVFTSTTSTYGDAMKSAQGEPAVWVTEALRPRPKNIYGVTKTSAEDLCSLFNRNTGLACVILKTSRFFPEADDDKHKRDRFDDDNLKVNELLFRRADIEDMVSAHLRAVHRANDIGFDRFIVTATTPFQPNDVQELASDARAVLERYVPDYVDVYARRGWRMFKSIRRVYDNTHAREKLGWVPRYNFEPVIHRLREGLDYRSELARRIGAKGYHDSAFEDGPYPTGSF